MKERTPLNRSRTFVGTDTAFLSEDAIDLDLSENYEVTRRRVFFDDVQLVTLHRERGVWFLLITGGWGILWTAFGLMFLAIDTKAWPATIPFAVIGLPALIACLLRLALGREVVSVFGRRSKVTLRFNVFRKRKARTVYGQICAAVRRAQSTATRAESPAPPLPPDVPLPPL